MNQPNEPQVKPAHWTTRPLASISRNIMDFRGRTPKKLGLQWGGGDIPALSAGNVRMGYIDFNAECYFGSDDLYRRWMTNGDPVQGDICLTTEAPLGNVATIPDHRKYILSQRTVLIQPDVTQVQSEYLFHFIRSDHFQGLLLENATGSTAKGIQRRRLEQLPISFPPLEEQCAIAKVLTDLDAILSELNALITKRRELKEAAMQQLLTGRVRLSKSGCVWARRRLGDLATMASGGTPASNVQRFYGGDIPWVSISDMTRSGKVLVQTERNLTAEGLAASSARVFPAGTVLYAMYASIGECSIAGMPLSTSQAILGIRPGRDLNTEFLYYSLVASKGSMSSLGQHGTQANLSKAIVQELLVPTPPLPEQTAIAEVLSDFDSEISSLQVRRHKVLDVRQAMMQQLLTGRIRLT